LSPDSSRAGLEPQEQAPGAADHKNQPRRVILRLIRKTDGRPIPGALVVVGSYDFDLPDGGSMAVVRQDEPERLTDPEGRCLIELPGEVSGLMIWAAEDGLAPEYGAARWQGERRLMFAADGVESRQEIRPGSVPTVTMELGPGQPIGGLVKDERGRPIEGAEITVAFHDWTRSPDEDLLEPQRISADDPSPYVRVRTDAEGRWRCSSLPADPGPNSALRLRVEHPDYVSDTGGFQRQLSLRTARAMTGVLPMKSGVSVSGLVRDTKGNPVSGARVALAYSNHPQDWLGTRTDARGRFVFVHADDHPPSRRWVVEVEAAGFAPAYKVTSPQSELPPVELSLSPGRPFYGRVVDRRGQPVAGVVLRAGLDDLDHLSWRAVSDAEGRFVWRDAPQEGKLRFELQDVRGGCSFAQIPAKEHRANLTFDPK
jgi:uncharacterized GH25 family protein